MVRLFLIIFITYLATSCAQVGCPGGMCPPDHYFAPYKKAGKRGMTSTNNTSPNYKNFNRGKNSHTDWSRKSSGSKFSFRRNFESDKYAGNRDSRNTSYTLLEDNPFSQKKSKSFMNSRLLGAKKIKNKNRSGHQEGLFAKNVSRYQDRKTYHIRRKGRLADKVGIKKLH